MLPLLGRHASPAAAALDSSDLCNLSCNTPTHRRRWTRWSPSGRGWTSECCPTRRRVRQPFSLEGLFPSWPCLAFRRNTQHTRHTRRNTRNSVMMLRMARAPFLCKRRAECQSFRFCVRPECQPFVLSLSIPAGAFILGGTDEIQTVLDDQIVKIQVCIWHDACACACSYRVRLPC